VVKLRESPWDRGQQHTSSQTLASSRGQRHTHTHTHAHTHTHLAHKHNSHVYTHVHAHKHTHTHTCTHPHAYTLPKLGNPAPGEKRRKEKTNTPPRSLIVHTGTTNSCSRHS